MPRDMFGDVVDPSIKLGSQKWYTVPLSILAHVVDLRGRHHHSADGDRRAAVAAVDDGVRGRPAAAAAAAAAAPGSGRGAAEGASRVVVNPNAAPIEAPKEIKPEVVGAERRRRRRRAVSKGASPAASSAAWSAACRRRRRRRPRLRPRRCASAATSRRRPRPRTSSPIYPPIAQSARVQGVVIIEATIGPDGRVKDAKVLRSIPLLDQAALDAVKQWQFTPTLLNGVPVPVIMTVTVNFTLQ